MGGAANASVVRGMLGDVEARVEGMGVRADCDRRGGSRGDGGSIVEGIVVVVMSVVVAVAVEVVDTGAGLAVPMPAAAVVAMVVVKADVWLSWNSGWSWWSWWS